MDRIVNVDTSHGNYDVSIGKSIDVGAELIKIHKPCRILVVSDDTVFGLYGEKCLESLRNAGFTAESFVFPHGEGSKHIGTVEDIIEYAASKSLTRRDLMLALGGGVVGDITGFCAAIYMRGIDFVQVPTTVLAAVDSSVGGKTAVDLKAGKNLAGAFHQPIAVYLDVNCFDSLPESIFAEGMAEAVKYGMILDGELFDKFEKGGYDMTDICARCVELKAYVVHEDECEMGLRRILNFGHTPGHAMEKLSNLSIPHGNAVAIGMMMMTKASEKKGMIPEGSTDRLKAVLEKIGLPISSQYSAGELAKASGSDKKRLGDTLGLVMLDKIGNAVIEEIPMDKVEEYYALGL